MAYSLGYAQLDALLAAAEQSGSAAHVHGQLLGVISVQDGACDDPANTLLTLPDGDTGQRLHQAVDCLYRETWQALDGAGVGFAMLLPDDSATLAQRAQGLIDWAQGFLHALQLQGVDPLRQLDSAGRSALDDIRQVAGQQPQQVAEDEEELGEVAEFLWIAAVLVRELLIVHRER